MMTIEQALALTPGGFKLTSFDGRNASAVWADRNGNEIVKFYEGCFARYNGEMSQNYDTINEACAWMEKKKKWWGK